MFSQTAEYALRVVAYLAAAGGKAATTRQIAASTHVPVGYLAKVLQSLSRGGIVRSQRGPRGGSVLARPAGQLTIYDVVQAVDPILRITSCPLGLESHAAGLCPVHRRLDDAIGLVERSFRDATIADLLTGPSRGEPLCEIDGAGKPAAVALTLPRGRRAART
jgi:Rrf2 family protein